MIGDGAAARSFLRDLETSWPPQHLETARGWRLRAAPGAGLRVNSALQVEAEPDQRDALPLIEQFYHQHGGSAAILLSGSALSSIGDENPELVEMMARRGYALAAACRLYQAPLTEPWWRPAKKPLKILEVQAELAALDRLWLEGGVGPDKRAVMRRASALKPAIFLCRLEARLAGAAFVAVVGARAFVHALYVTPNCRQYGVGRALLSACAAHGAGLGAAWLAASVEEGAAASQALFESVAGAQIGACAYFRAPGPRR
ncbi:MAG: GNAT family N-acetyltransferase [Neomegalonema sp.]|nr:GNAT family N-acetyltransferase [Neomegalonema sp.]